ncbi:hypothetical protein D5F51_05195 [Yersinia hibernica]|uniref:Uncharacterized protein n=1 Tax=Yersinia hibernica TaxID=2339259 RepID=A0ABX5QXD7_9GAMM|nr:hypothetical protein D5F51_05195 [Yersinia hibernica]
MKTPLFSTYCIAVLSFMQVEYVHAITATEFLVQNKKIACQNYWSNKHWSVKSNLAAYSSIMDPVTALKLHHIQQNYKAC